MHLDILKFQIKSHLPFLRRRWPNLTKVLAHWANICSKEFSFTNDDGVLMAHGSNGLKLYGFENTEREEKLIIMLRNDPLFNFFDKKYFRLMTDIICRYKFPHLRPDLCPQIVERPDHDTKYMEGFHGQHRDTIIQVTDKVLKEKLFKEFSLKKDDIIFDCGSFLGFGAIALSPILKNGRIISIEASDKCFNVLKKNVESNNIKNIDIIKGSVWLDEGTEMSLAKTGFQANSLIRNIIDDIGKNVEEEKVRSVSIDSVVENRNLNKVNMISLTLNGAEVEALKGAEKTLINLRPRLRLAGWYKRDNEFICDICKRYLEKLNYFVYIGERRGLLAVPLEKMS